jgi:Phage integrase family
VSNGDRWTVRLAAIETKMRRADVWPLAPVLGLYLEDYVRVVRPMLLRRARYSPATPRLWIGDSGRPIGDQVLRRIVGRVTEERLGIRLNPHAFRHCAATTFAFELPHDALQSAALLGHSSPQTTEQHYIVQQRQLIQEEYLRLLQHRRIESSEVVEEYPTPPATGHCFLSARAPPGGPPVAAVQAPREGHNSPPLWPLFFAVRPSGSDLAGRPSEPHPSRLGTQLSPDR